MTSPIIEKLRRQSTLAVRVSAVTFAVALGAAGCGSSAGNETTAPRLDETGVATLDGSAAGFSGGQVDRTAGIAAYEECLVDSGVDLAAVESNDFAEAERALNDPNVVAAMSTCSEHLEAAAGDVTLDPVQQAGLIDQSATFAACLRSVLNVEVPDGVLLLDPSDPRVSVLEELAPSPNQERQLATCVEVSAGPATGEDG